MGYYETNTQKEMKAILLTVIFLLIFRAVLAPEARMLWVEASKKIGKLDKIIEAVAWVESGHGKYVWNPEEGAVGWLQIRQCRVDDYNRQTGNNYRLEDFYDYELSRKMFIWYAEKIGLNNTDLLIRKWNGSGKKTYEYLAKVQKVYLSL